MFVTDISQSMNTIDMSVMNKPISRLEYMKHSLHEIMSELPCGTKVSIGMFVGVSVAASYTPIEVCENFDAIGIIVALDYKRNKYFIFDPPLEFLEKSQLVGKESKERFLIRIIEFQQSTGIKLMVL